MADKFNDKIDASHEKKLRTKSDRLVDLKKRDFVKTIQSTSVTLDVTVPCLSS